NKRRGFLRIDNGDREPGAGARHPEQQSGQSTARDHKLDIIVHRMSMMRARSAVQPSMPISSAALKLLSNFRLTSQQSRLHESGVCCSGSLRWGVGPASGDSVARSGHRSAGERARRSNGMGELLVTLKRRALETVGLALLLASLLLVASLLTYDPHDASLNTAVDAGPPNLLGDHGAKIPHLLWETPRLARFFPPRLFLRPALPAFADLP